MLKAFEKKPDVLVVFEVTGLLEVVRVIIALLNCSRFRRCRSRLLQNFSLNDLILVTLSVRAKHCSCRGFDEECELSINRVLFEYSFRVLLWREDFLRGGEGGLDTDIARDGELRGEALMTGGDLEVAENGTGRSDCENEEKTIDVLLEALLRCTRILVKVGEIGKYSISESSVDKVSDRFAFSCKLNFQPFLPFIPCHQEIKSSKVVSLKAKPVAPNLRAVARFAASRAVVLLRLAVRLFIKENCKEKSL